VDFADNASQPTSTRADGKPGAPLREKCSVIYAFGTYRIDTSRFEIARGARVLPAEPQVLELLIFLIDNRDHVVSRDDLLESIWKGRMVSDATLSSRVKSARQLIGDNGARQQYIKTIHGRGFRFVGAVETPGRAEPAQEPAQRRPVHLEHPSTHYARSDHTHIAYQVFGEGPVNLVLAPGFVSHIDNYWDDPHLARWLTRLAGMARVAIFDKRGTGMSDRVASLPGMDERMDDVRAVMDATGFDTAFIMGISEGGSLATLFSAHHPTRCDGLILYGSFAQFRYWFPDRASLQGLFDYIEGHWGSGQSLPQFAPSMAGDAAFLRWWGRFERLGATPGAAISLMTMNSRIDISDILPSIQVPALVIHRSDDVLIDVEAGRQLGARIPGAQYVELPGRDHLPWVGENPDEVIDAIERFLGRTRSPRHVSRVLATILMTRLDAARAARFSDADRSRLLQELNHFRVNRVVWQPSLVVSTFDGPARALECAVSVSRWLRDEGIDHRMGVHTGEIEFEDGVPNGKAVDITADVAGHATRNEILVSRTVHDLVAGASTPLEDRGEFRLPTIEQRWRLFRPA
jgi:pimeloyl-ACP methyl ester carboxylesterase